MWLASMQVIVCARSRALGHSVEILQKGRVGVKARGLGATELLPLGLAQDAFLWIPDRQQEHLRQGSWACRPRLHVLPRLIVLAGSVDELMTHGGRGRRH